MLLSVAAVSSCTTRLWGWADAWAVKPVLLTRELPMQIVEKSPAFDCRVKARFPLGTQMTDVGNELAREGFVRQDWAPLRTGEHYAKRYDGGAPVCDLEAWVYWLSDENDRLTAIRGIYQSTCL